jgi:hypothetical protein
VITFANVGDMDATGVQLGMQIPYGTAFANYDDAGVLFLNGHGVSGAGGAPTHTDRTPEQVKLSGPSADVVTWHIGTLPAHSSGAIKLRAHVIFDFLDNSVRDHSLYISASNARSVVVSPDPIGTWISSRTFAASKGSILPKVLENLRISGGSDPQLNQVLTDYLGTMTANAQLDSIAGADALLLLEGQRIIPLGNNQALVIDSTGTGSTKTLSGATMLVNSGPTRVAAGPADKIQIDNLALNVRAAAGVSGSGIPTCADLLAHAIDVANAQGADIQRSKANNLVNDDSGSPVLVSNTNGLGLSLVPKNVVMVQAGVSTVGKVAGNITAVGGVVSDLVKLRPQEGGTTVTGTNAGLAVTSNGGVYNNAGHIVAQGAGNVISNDGGTIVAAGGGNAVSKDGQAFASDGGADLVNTNGSNIVAQGGLNLTPSGTAGLVSEGGAQLVSHGSSVIGENSSGIVGQGGGN